LTCQKQSELIDAAAPALPRQALAREVETQLKLFADSECAVIREQSFQHPE
jgi:hypothetical protein